MSRPFSSDYADARTLPQLGIDWSTAPAWAKFHAFDMAGRGAWHQEKPHISPGQWFWTQIGNAWPSGHSLAAGVDWRETLTEKGVIPTPSGWGSFAVTYFVTNGEGTVHTGRGVVRMADIQHAGQYALQALKFYCPECAGFTGHAVTVNPVDLSD